MANLFICHRKEDKELAVALANNLKQKNHNIWFDEWNIGVGDSIVAEIDKGLFKTEYLILCYSTSGTSEWTDREWHSSLHRQLSGHNVKTLPIRLSGGTPPAILADVKYADFVSDWNQALIDLLKAIK